MYVMAFLKQYNEIIIKIHIFYYVGRNLRVCCKLSFFFEGHSFETLLSDESITENGKYICEVLPRMIETRKSLRDNHWKSFLIIITDDDNFFYVIQWRWHHIKSNFKFDFLIGIVNWNIYLIHWKCSFLLIHRTDFVWRKIEGEYWTSLTWPKASWSEDKFFIIVFLRKIYFSWSTLLNA